MDNKNLILLLPLHSRSAIEAHRPMTTSSFKRPMPPLSPKISRFSGTPIREILYQRYSKGIQESTSDAPLPLGNHRFGYRVLRAKALVSNVGYRGGETHPLSPRRGR